MLSVYVLFAGIVLVVAAVWITHNRGKVRSNPTKGVNMETNPDPTPVDAPEPDTSSEPVKQDAPAAPSTNK